MRSHGSLEAACCAADRGSGDTSPEVSMVQARWDHKAGPLRFQPRHDAIVKAAEIHPGMRVLDLASGRGEVAILAAKAGAVVRATDVGPQLVQVIERNAREAGVKVSAQLGDMRNLPFPDGSFDRVLGAAALHHLDRPGARASVLEAIRVLAPGGRALFSEPTENSPVFDAAKHVFPSSLGRPSSLQRAAWQQWMQTRDDRSMSDEELLAAHPSGRIVARVGMFARVLHHPNVDAFDRWFLKMIPAAGICSQAAIVEYRR